MPWIWNLKDEFIMGRVIDFSVTMRFGPMSKAIVVAAQNAWTHRLHKQWNSWRKWRTLEEMPVFVLPNHFTNYKKHHHFLCFRDFLADAKRAYFQVHSQRKQRVNQGWKYCHGWIMDNMKGRIEQFSHIITVSKEWVECPCKDEGREQNGFHRHQRVNTVQCAQGKPKIGSPSREKCLSNRWKKDVKTTADGQNLVNGTLLIFYLLPYPLSFRKSKRLNIKKL